MNATKNARLVEQSRAFEDSRRCQVGLTERGRALVEAAFARTLQVLDEIPEGWSDDNDLCDLGRHLRRLNQGFDRIEGRS